MNRVVGSGMEARVSGMRIDGFRRARSVTPGVQVAILGVVQESVRSANGGVERLMDQVGAEKRGLFGEAEDASR